MPLFYKRWTSSSQTLFYSLKSLQTSNTHTHTLCDQTKTVQIMTANIRQLQGHVTIMFSIPHSQPHSSHKQYISTQWKTSFLLTMINNQNSTRTNIPFTSMFSVFTVTVWTRAVTITRNITVSITKCAITTNTASVVMSFSTYLYTSVTMTLIGATFSLYMLWIQESPSWDQWAHTSMEL